jgi:hypothetical protein
VYELAKHGVLDFNHFKALVVLPPSHEPSPEQSSNCCSAKIFSSPVWILLVASTSAIEPKVQQLPQLPWSFTGVTPPLETQSMELASLAPNTSSRIGHELLSMSSRSVKYTAANSWGVMPENWLTPYSAVVLREFNRLISTTFSL